MSTIYNENQIPSNESSQSVENHHKQIIEQSERIRRLIPYMAFYIPKPNQDYLPLSDVNSYKQMVIYLIYANFKAYKVYKHAYT